MVNITLKTFIHEESNEPPRRRQSDCDVFLELHKNPEFTFSLAC